MEKIHETNVEEEDLGTMYLFNEDGKNMAGAVCQVLDEHFRKGQYKGHCQQDPLTEETCLAKDKLFEN